MRRYEYDEDIEERHFSWTDLFIKVIIVLIFILFTVWLISLPNRKRVSSTNNNNVGSASAFSENINNMRDVGQSYFTTERLPEKEGDIKTITLEKMYKNKMLLTLTDKNGKACSAKNSYVSIQKVGNEYQMKTYLECGKDKDYIITTMGCYNYCKTDICEKEVNYNNKNNNNNNNNNNNDNSKTAPTPASGVEYQYVKNTNGKWGNWGKYTNWLTTKVVKNDYTDVDTKVVSEYDNGGKTEYKLMGVASCPTVSSYQMVSNVNGICTYSKTNTSTTDPTCPSVSGYKLSSRNGFTCNYTKTNTSTTNPTCPSVSGYKLSSRNGFTCNYSKTVTSSTDYTLSYYSTGSGSYVPADTKTYHYVQKSADYVYKCDGSCGMRWYYTYTIYKKTYKTNTYTTTRTATCSTGVPSGSVCAINNTSTTTRTATCSTGVPSGNTCTINTSSITTRDARCPDGQNNENGKCYKLVGPTTRNVTYYRYRTRNYINGTTDYKWSSTNNDKSLLEAGYKLTGTTRNVKGEK